MIRLNVKLTGVDIKGKSANRPRGEYKKIKCKVGFLWLPSCIDIRPKCFKAGRPEGIE